MSWRLAKNSYPSSTTFAKEYAKSIMHPNPLVQLFVGLMSSTDQVHLLLPVSDNVGLQQAQGPKGPRLNKNSLLTEVLPSICKNVETTSGPKMKETPRSFSAQPAMSWQRLAMLHANRPSM